VEFGCDGLRPGSSRLCGRLKHIQCILFQRISDVLVRMIYVVVKANFELFFHRIKFHQKNKPTIKMRQTENTTILKSHRCSGRLQTAYPRSVASLLAITPTGGRSQELFNV
jgi:hypothetical protein